MTRITRMAFSLFGSGVSKKGKGIATLKSNFPVWANVTFRLRLAWERFCQSAKIQTTIIMVRIVPFVRRMSQRFEIFHITVRIEVSIIRVVHGCHFGVIFNIIFNNLAVNKQKWSKNEVKMKWKWSENETKRLPWTTLIVNEAFVKALGDLCGADVIFLLSIKFYHGLLYSSFSSFWKDISMHFICKRL